MVVFCLGLFLAEIIWSTEGALIFTKEPKKTVRGLKGSDAIFEWDYSIDDRAAELEYIFWKVENKSSSGDFSTLIYENENFDVVINSKMPAPYLGRVEKKGRATLVIKNIKFEDATTYKCVLKGKGVRGFNESFVQLVVAGPASMQQPVQFVEVGATATITCNAVDVQSHDFNWTKPGQTDNIENDDQHTIVSVTGSSQLTIKNVTAANKGNYMYVCAASVDTKETTLASGYLQVIAKLTEYIKDDDPYKKRNYAVNVGEQLSIFCPVSGYPLPFVSWYKNGTLFLKGENVRLSFNPVKDYHFGNYTCTGTDGKTTIGPLTISIKPILAVLIIIESTDGTPEKPAKLVWAPQADAENYVVKITKNDYIFDDEFLIGTGTSVEFHYHTLVLKKAESKPEEVVIDVEVTAMRDTRVVAKTPMLQKLTVKLPSDTKS